MKWIKVTLASTFPHLRSCFSDGAISRPKAHMLCSRSLVDKELQPKPGSKSKMGSFMSVCNVVSREYIQLFNYSIALFRTVRHHAGYNVCSFDVDYSSKGMDFLGNGGFAFLGWLKAYSKKCLCTCDLTLHSSQLCFELFIQGCLSWCAYSLSPMDSC